MTSTLRIGLIGDRNDEIVAHRAAPVALAMAARALSSQVDVCWLATDANGPLDGFDGLWCMPGSPYRDMDGALRAVRHAREQGLPFLGTCGGFQHAVIEFARHVLGWHDAEHAESSPDAARPVIVPLACALVEVRESIALTAGSRLARACGTGSVDEGYHCRYGLAPGLEAALAAAGLQVAARDADGDVRALELAGHPFFVATLFQPERAALAGRTPPVVLAFSQAAASRFR